MRMLNAIAATLLLAACGGDDTPKGGLSADEAAQLDNAAEMLDASPDSLAAPEDMPLDSESQSGNRAAAANAQEAR